jgi:hypothetical protein
MEQKAETVSFAVRHLREEAENAKQAGRAAFAHFNNDDGAVRAKRLSEQLAAELNDLADRWHYADVARQEKMDWELRQHEAARRAAKPHKQLGRPRKSTPTATPATPATP